MYDYFNFLNVIFSPGQLLQKKNLDAKTTSPPRLRRVDLNPGNEASIADVPRDKGMLVGSTWRIIPVSK